MLARKGVLASDPSVREMTDMMWLLEYHALVAKEQAYATLSAKLLKNVMVSVLGLNSLIPTDEDGVPKEFEDMTDEEKERFIPLIYWADNIELMKEVNEQNMVKQAVNSTSDDYEKLVSSIDEHDGDMEPVLGPVNIIPLAKTQHYLDELAKSVKTIPSLKNDK